MALWRSRLLRTAARPTGIERPRLIPQKISDHINTEGPEERLPKEEAVTASQKLADRPARFVFFASLLPRTPEHPYLISVKWSPGYTDIFGNELADQLAKHGATLLTNEDLPSVSSRKRQTKKQIA